jgi:3-hydroxyacyl-CoA dehydrogenase / enoyl-CoA hydratase / 3-hydroxybutyryl-CoA epimerase / enoyl-CoA isomerase
MQETTDGNAAMADSIQFEELKGDIGLLTIDCPDQSVNTLSSDVMAELGEYVDRLEQRTDLKGLLFRSGKPGQFIAGADLRELSALVEATEEQVIHGVARGHELYTRISRLPFPTVALVAGHCMGGGTELILSMDERLAASDGKTSIALPEVKLGIIPGWGGTQRMPRLIGIHQGITLVCSGDTVHAERAVQLGLVFDAVPSEQLLDEGRRLIELTQESGDWRRNRERREQPLGLSEDQLQFAVAVAEGHLRGKTGDNYPAPLTALKVIREGINLPLDDGLRVEREAAVEIIRSPTAASLIGMFFKNRTVSQNPGIELKQVPARDVHRVGVLGAGLMGSGIATAHARRGLPAVMVDVDEKRVAAGLKSAAHVVESRIRIGRATPEDMAHMLALLSTSTTHHVFADCDVVVEAVTENEQLKTRLYQELKDYLRDDAILASNTSTISITRMAQSAPCPERFVGMHFFSPVDRMALVEVIRGDATSDETTATIVKLAQRIGKTPIVVRDCPGFLVNRLLMPYMAEAVLMLTEGAGMDAIDRVATKFGMPVGPIALHDMVGIDTACFAGHVLAAAYGDRTVETNLLKVLVDVGRLGKKSGAGFRRFVGRTSKPVDDPEFGPILEQCRTGQREFTEDEIRDRLFLPMLLEAALALEEGIVQEPAHVDVALLLGIGFPAFRGGLLGWCDREGAGAIVERAARYASLGPRFQPTALLRDMAAAHHRFYPRTRTGSAT